MTPFLRLFACSAASVFLLHCSGGDPDRPANAGPEAPVNAPDAGDGGTSMDADASDGSTHPDYLPGTWCAANAPAQGYCNDFDDPSRTLAEFSTDGNYPDASIALDTSAPSSPPRSALLTLPAGIYTCSQEALARPVMDGNAVSTVSYAFDVRPGDSDGSGYAGGRITTFIHTSLYGACDFAVTLSDSATTLAGEAIPPTGSIIGLGQLIRQPLPIGVWSRVGVTASFDPASLYVSLSINSENLGSLPLPQTCRAAGRADVTLGFSCTPEGTQPQSMRIDNVTIEGH